MGAGVWALKSVLNQETRAELSWYVERSGGLGDGKKAKNC